MFQLSGIQYNPCCLAANFRLSFGRLELEELDDATAGSVPQSFGLAAWRISAQSPLQVGGSWMGRLPCNTLTTPIRNREFMGAFWAE